MANNILKYPNVNYVTIDNHAQLSSTAGYDAEYSLLKNLTYGVLISSNISKGQISSIDSRRASSLQGVIAVISHLNRPDLPLSNYSAVCRSESMSEHDFPIFFDDRIHFYRQPVALVIAHTLETALEAARFVKIFYKKEPQYNAILKYKTKRFVTRLIKENGNKGSNSSSQVPTVIIQAEYNTSIHDSVPVKIQAAIGVLDATDKIKNFTGSEIIKKVQKDIKKTFRIKEENVPLHATSVSVGFEAHSRLWAQEVAAIMGVKKTGNPVVVISGKDQLNNMAVYRPASMQKFTICAGVDGIISGMAHEAIVHKPFKKELSLGMKDAAKPLYAGSKISTIFKEAPLIGNRPARLNDIGASCNSFAFESLLDELACILRLDPIVLRLKNFAEKEFGKASLWSKNKLEECFGMGSQMANDRGVEKP